MKLFIMLLTLLFTPVAQAKQELLYNKIIQYNPKIDKAFAKEIATKLSKKAKEQQINPEIALAVLLQESGLNKTTTFKTETIKEEYCDETNCFKIVKQVQKGFDFSFAQINIGTIKNYRLNIKKLYENDVDYVLDSFVFILKEKINMCSHLQDSWSCYHSINSPHRDLYIELVKRYM